MRNIATGHISVSFHRHRVLHQRYPAKVPQYVAQSLAKAALASSIASVAANNILIVSSYGSGSGARRCWPHYIRDANQAASEFGARARVALASPARPPLRQGPRSATAK